MTIKKLGHALIASGGIAIAFSLLVDLIGIGDDGIQAAQLLGIQAGAFLLLTGIGLSLTKWSNDIRIAFNLRAWIIKIMGYPVIVWVLVTFVASYSLLFISYVFLNPGLQMNYLTKYLPEAGRIGLDIRAIMRYIEEWLVLDQSPYATGFIAYPPLTLVLFAPLLLIGYPAYFKLMTLITLIGFGTATLFIPLALNKSKGVSIILLMFVTGLFSYGLQFELERGQSNMIAFALGMVSIYLFHAHPKLRFFSYILFSLAVQLKIYPVIFIIMLIDNWRDWKTNFVRLAGISLFNIALLFVLGFDLFQDFLASTLLQQSQSATWNGVSIRSFVFVLSNTGYSVFPESIISAAGQYPRVFELSFLALFFLCLITLIVLAFIRRENGFNPYLLLACTVGALIIPAVSNDYKLPLIIGPVSILLSGWPAMKKVSKKFASIVLLIIVLMAFWTTLYPFKIKPEILHNSMPVLLLILIAVTVVNLLTDESKSLNLVAGTDDENNGETQST
jgi:hypothetical protein